MRQEISQKASYKISKIVLFTVMAIFALVEPAAPYSFQAKVIGIMDGDTIEVLHDRSPLRIRLYGIDTPEHDQDFGTRAKQFTSEKVFGKMVEVEPMDEDPTPPWDFRRHHVSSKHKLAQSQTAQPSEPKSGIVYHGNVKSKVFHKPDCKYYDCKNCTPNFNSKEAAEKEGYRPCSICSQCHTISKKRTECS